MFFFAHAGGGGGGGGGGGEGGGGGGGGGGGAAALAVGVLFGGVVVAHRTAELTVASAEVVLRNSEIIATKVCEQRAVLSRGGGLGSLDRG